MKDLAKIIPIGSCPALGDGLIDTVNARDLHKALEVKTAFKDWVTRRIEDCRFQEGSDFCSFLSESTGGRPAKEYFLTLDAAKHFAMMERNEAGFAVRTYFIEHEKKAKAMLPRSFASPHPAPQHQPHVQLRGPRRARGRARW